MVKIKQVEREILSVKRERTEDIEGGRRGVWESENVFYAVLNSKGML